MALSELKDLAVHANTSKNLAPSINSLDPSIPLHQRLRIRLLLLIILSVFVTEVLVFVPTIADIQTRWLENRHKSVQAISMVLINDDPIIDDNLRKHILDATEALSLTITEPDGKHLEIRSSVYENNGKPIIIDEDIDLSQFSETTAILSSAWTLLTGGDKILRMSGPIKDSNAILTLTVSDVGLRQALIHFSIQFLLISFTIAIVAATLIYLVIYELLVHPLQRIYINVLEFAMEPDNPARIIVPDARRDEVGLAQHRIAAIERELQKSYARQKHLADLGLAVSKINHDMRNILASAQLMSDHLAEVENPVVQKLSPKLMRTISRAITYTQSVIAYGRSLERPPKLKSTPLHALVEEARDTLAVAGKDQVTICNLVPDNFEVNVDSEHMLRVIINLCRNAVQAMTASNSANSDQLKQITITSTHKNSGSLIDIIDTGPGLPAKAKEHLFAPFQSAARSDGTGLGLAICLELVRAHNGTLNLIEDGKDGAHFQIFLPHSRC